MSSPAKIIQKLLIDLGHGTESGDWRTFVSFMPHDPDNAICVYDTAGIQDGRFMLTGEKIDHPGIQIRVRGNLYPTAWNKAEDIALALDSQKRVIVAIPGDASYTLLNISRTGTIIPLGIEQEGDQRRHHFTINAILTIEKG